MGKKLLLVAVLCSLSVAGFLGEPIALAGKTSQTDYQVPEPIKQGNLEVFPIVAAVTHDTSEFLTLDEGLKSGEVVVTEYGKVPGLIRRHPTSGGWDGTA